MSEHSGAILCLSCLSFGTNPNKTRADEHRAIIDAFKCAKQSNSEPTAICLQDYQWNTERCLAELIDQINEAHGSATWRAVRQWGNEDVDMTESPRDAVVLYDTSVYAEKDMERHSIGKFHDFDHLLAGMRPEIKHQLESYDGRWAGATLQVPSGRKFFLVSFHGRKVMSIDGEVQPIQTAVKTSMAKEFIGHVANVSVKDGSPALIAGSWNTNSEPLRATKLEDDEWSATVHVYPEQEAPRRSSLDAKGMPKGRVDYSVAVHPKASACTDMSVSEVHVLPLDPEIAGNFQHMPLLIQFKLEAKE